MKVVDQKAQNVIRSASMEVEKLGTMASRDLAGVIDLGDGFQ